MMATAAATATTTTAAAAREEELPLLIQDYSCANSFEEHVRMIETYLAALFDAEPLLQSFLVPQSSVSLKSTWSSSAPTSKSISTAPSPSPDDDDSDNSPSSSSLVSLLDDSNNSAASNVFSQTMTLYAPPTPGTSGSPPQLDLELSIAVEVHVRDTAHLITQQYCTPLFFLIRKVTTSAAYRESETSYLLSLLSTAVRQVLRQQKNGAVLRIGATTAPPRLSGCAVPPHSAPSAKSAAATLPSPFSFPDGCAPCFAPAGDSYKQSFVGVAPPLPAMGALPPPPGPPTAISTAEWNLLHQRAFTTRFLSDAFAHPPKQCRTLSEFIDLFQLHVGQHSRIRSDDFEGICVSMWETYVLPIPWRFHPYGPPLSPEMAAAAAKKSKLSSPKPTASEGASATPSLTWSAVLERENAYTQLLSGTFAHAFGTPSPPLQHVLFRFQWNQLQDVEAHEPSGRGSHLSPFQFAAHPLSTAAQAAQRKCFITAQAVVRNEEHIECGVSQRLREVVEQRYLDPLARCAAPSPRSPVSRSRPLKQRRKGGGKDDTDSSGGIRGGKEARETPPQSPNATTAPPAESSTDSGDAISGVENPTLHELAATIVEWKGSNVNLQASLLSRFAEACPTDRSEHDDDVGGNVDNTADGKGHAGQTRGGVTAAAAQRSSTAVARCLRKLWTEWEAHQQLFPRTDGTVPASSPTSASPPAQKKHQQQQEPTSAHDAQPNTAATFFSTGTAQHLPRAGGSVEDGAAAAVSDKDLRAAYFPESFFARFAYTCATQVPHPEDVRVLWQLCVERLRCWLLSESSNDQERNTSGERSAAESWQRLLDCLALPRSDPPVNFDLPLISQKFQLLSFALYLLLHPTESTYGASDASPGTAARVAPSSIGPENKDARHSADVELHLITNGEVLVVPAPLPTPPTTADLVLQRARELNTLGAAAVENATTAWLQGDALYNDMCLFLYVNKAQDGRVVRFPDFVQWHSPRDFVKPASSPTVSLTQRSDNDYLSDRMKDQRGSGRGSLHVWWSLWSRAVPRSRDDILRTLFQPLEEATRVVDWLAALPTAVLLLELGNACVSNALHRMLCHRFLLGDAGSRASATGRNSLIPASPRLRPLYCYVREKCSSLTKELEAASAVFTSRVDVTGGDSGVIPASSAMQAMELEMLRSFMTNALREVGEIEVALCTAVAIHYLLGFAADADAAAAVRGLCAPQWPSQSQRQQQQCSSSGLQMCSVTVTKEAWTTCFARQFLQPDSRTAQERMVRLTCMAERPLNTCGCFQQLVVHQDTSHILRMALALTKEVL
jgi:hypothetical protein